MCLLLSPIVMINEMLRAELILLLAAIILYETLERNIPPSDNILCWLDFFEFFHWFIIYEAYNVYLIRRKFGAAEKILNLARI